MAAADYKLCDVCGTKAFYDASLNYEVPGSGLHDLLGNDLNIGLDYCAQHAAICNVCYSIGWRLQVVRE